MGYLIKGDSMIRFRNRTAYAAVLTLVLASAIAGCSDDENNTAPGVDPAVVGTWNATSFLLMGNDLITQGVGVSLVFNSNGTYAITFTNDQAGDLCDVGMTDCSDSGTYTASDTQIILDAGGVDEATLNYSIIGTTMTIAATIDGEAIVVVLTKA